MPVRMQGTDDWPLAEIISIRDVQGKNMYYVHYVDCELGFVMFDKKHQILLLIRLFLSQ